MFDNLRLPSLSIPGLSLSRRSSPTPPPQSPSSSASKDLLPHVNLYAGCDLLEYFHVRWRNLNQTCLENQKMALHAAREIERVDELTSGMCDSMTKLHNELSMLDDIDKQLEDIELELGKTTQCLDKLNDAIAQLQIQQTRQDVERQKQEAQCKLEKCIDAKSQKLEDYRKRLLAQHEEKEKRALREREAVFKQAFEEELLIFKEKGQLPRLNTKVGEDSKDLGNVTIEFDEQERQNFEKFLED